MEKSKERLIKEQAIDQDASTTGRGPSDGPMKNKRLDDGWISEQLKDRWMDQRAIEGTMDSASGRWIREL